MPLPTLLCDLGRVDYRDTATLQRQLRLARERGMVENVLLVLEHDPVISAGYRTEFADIAFAQTMDVPIVATERGGKATWHGPGQIVAYPIFDLREHGEDVRAFVRGLEQVLIDVLAENRVPADRREEYPGVWVADRKIASLGLRVTKWISFHGIALNVDCDLSPFGWFTPCGIPEVRMTNLATELAPAACPDIATVRTQLIQHMAAQFDLELNTIGADELRALVADILVEEPDVSLPTPDVPVVTA